MASSLTLPRLAFSRPGQASTTPEQAVPFQTGLPLSNGSTLREHLEAATLVGNLGNMIHRMGMLQMVNCDRSRSSQVHLFKLMKVVGGPKQAAAILNSNFDGLVITMSNVLRPDAEEPSMAELMTALSIPIYCVGIGLQDQLEPGDASILRQSVQDFVRVLEEKATLFGVRGHQTLEWLRSIGIRRAEALGCPSMFAYPKNVLSTGSPSQAVRVISAGHLKLTRDETSRSHKMMRGFEELRPSYVFQGEISQFRGIIDQPHVYDEATQTLDFKTTSDYLTKRLGVTPPFQRYYSFGESAAWRQACSHYDVYVGDRIHGGVAALQVGVPALVLHTDRRVQELTSFHGIPSCSLDEFSETGCQSAIEKYLNPDAMNDFHGRYSDVLGNFESTLEAAGLTLTNRIQSVTGSASEKQDRGNRIE